MVEPQPSKLMVWVRFPSPAPDLSMLDFRLVGLDANGLFMNVSAHIAQSVEHFLGKEEVTGSNPVMSSRFSAVAGFEFLFFYLVINFLNC